MSKNMKNLVNSLRKTLSNFGKMLGTMKIGNSKPKTINFDKNIKKNTTPKNDWKDIKVGMSLLTNLLQANENLIFLFSS